MYSELFHYKKIDEFIFSYLRIFKQEEINLTRKQRYTLNVLMRINYVNCVIKKKCIAFGKDMIKSLDVFKDQYNVIDIAFEELNKHTNEYFNLEGEYKLESNFTIDLGVFKLIFMLIFIVGGAIALFSSIITFLASIGMFFWHDKNAFTVFLQSLVVFGLTNLTFYIAYRILIWPLKLKK